ncbi:hypothetical protein [Vibrio alginolyticus]|uniref:hypothetical protein n=1 Tax=Vibrio alginolyticus TaxID=663 RepID=UPI00215F127E|nr:hypothetical protein [Vibrio alginolyticus]ELB2785600.1 hypothetical protein [Vibrio alginolyticus]MCS0231481.1 hypothetical protein [Vibrio alginolyticus]MCS0274719.1 hypothetical protein [Vibrio alginolyticus]
MLVQSAIHFALDYVIQSACRYFEVSISSNKVWGRNELRANLPQCDHQAILSYLNYQPTPIAL